MASVKERDIANTVKQRTVQLIWLLRQGRDCLLFSLLETVVFVVFAKKILRFIDNSVFFRAIAQSLFQACMMTYSLF